MNILDEDIVESQRQLLRSWRIRIRQIGYELGHKGMQDEEIIPFLLTLKRPTFFTRDFRLYQNSLCHSGYCLVILAVGQYEAAHFIRRLLRYKRFESHAVRLGAVIRVAHTGISAWRVNAGGEDRFSWRT